MPSNVDLTRDLYDAFNKGDVPAVLGMMTQDIKWEEPETLPYGTHVGPEAVADKVFSLVVQHIDEFSVEPDEWIDGGDTVVVLGTYRGRGATTGKVLDTPFVHVWRLTGGKISGFRTSVDTHRWLEVMGAVAG
jgi:ketosteroid isomerase-like protein